MAGPRTLKIVLETTDIDPYQLSFLRGLALTETDLLHKEAYSEAYNQESNNANVRQYGQDGADYGYYQTNALDVKDAIKKGVDKKIAVHLNGGGKNGKSTMEEQTVAMHEYVKRKYPNVYQALKTGKESSFDDAKCAMQGQWFGLKDRPEVALVAFRKGKLKEFDKIFPELYK